jgi:hypothetical protein
MSPPHYTLAQISFTLSALLLLCRTGWWIAFEQSGEVGTIKRGLAAFFLLGLIGMAWVISVTWVDTLRTQESKPSQSATNPSESSATPVNGDSESYIPWGDQQVTIIGSVFGNHLPDVKAGRISNSLLDSGIAGSIRIVYVGAFHPELADQLFAEFQRGGWKPEILQVDLILERHAQESLYLLSPDLGGQKTRAAIDALERADLSIPAYTGKSTVGPTSAGIPDVTIVIKQQ